MGSQQRNVVCSCELAWRGPFASTGRDKLDRQLKNFVIWPPARDLLHSFPHSRYDVLRVWPGPAQEFGKQSTLSGNDWSVVDDDVELPSHTLFELDGCPQSVMDEGSENAYQLYGRSASCEI
jgi:hypothetical protein